MVSEGLPDLSGPPRLLYDEKIGQTVKTVVVVKKVMIKCSKCGDTFDRNEHNGIGKATECINCATPEARPRYTGVMIFGGKHGAEIQINADPELTKYMLGASTKHSATPTPTKAGGKVVKHVTGLENRRHGSSDSHKD